MIDIEARRRADAELERLRRMLDDRGTRWEERGEGTPMIEFRNGTGTCRVFPSQTEDGEIVVLYQGKGRVRTADEVLALCGMGDR